MARLPVWPFCGREVVLDLFQSVRLNSDLPETRGFPSNLPPPRLAYRRPWRLPKFRSARGRQGVFLTTAGLSGSTSRGIRGADREADLGTCPTSGQGPPRAEVQLLAPPALKMLYALACGMTVCGSGKDMVVYGDVPRPSVLPAGSITNDASGRSPGVEAGGRLPDAPAASPR